MAGLETSNPSGKWTPINTDEDRNGDFKTIHILSNKLFAATTAPRPFATFLRLCGEKQPVREGNFYLIKRRKSPPGGSGGLEIEVSMLITKIIRMLRASG
jgi:hypothetical protein